MMTSAEVKFLMAEATVKKWNVGSVSAEDLYKQGVRAAMDFLTDNYGCTATTDAEFDAFIQGRGRSDIRTIRNLKLSIHRPGFFTSPILPNVGQTCVVPVIRS